MMRNDWWDQCFKRKITLSHPLYLILYERKLWQLLDTLKQYGLLPLDRSRWTLVQQICGYIICNFNEVWRSLTSQEKECLEWLAENQSLEEKKAVLLEEVEERYGSLPYEFVLASGNSKSYSEEMRKYPYFQLWRLGLVGTRREGNKKCIFVPREVLSLLRPQAILLRDWRSYMYEMGVDDPLLRFFAVRRLGSSVWPKDRYISSLRKFTMDYLQSYMFYEPHPDVLREILSLLSEEADPDHAPEVAHLLFSENDWVVGRAAECLAEIGSEEHGRKIFEIISSRNKAASVLPVLWRALGSFTEPRNEEIIEFIQRADLGPEELIAAACCLVEREAWESIEFFLERYFDTPKNQMRQVAAMALSTFLGFNPETFPLTEKELLADIEEMLTSLSLLEALRERERSTKHLPVREGNVFYLPDPDKLRAMREELWDEEIEQVIDAQVDYLKSVFSDLMHLIEVRAFNEFCRLVRSIFLNLVMMPVYVEYGISPDDEPWRIFEVNREVPRELIMPWIILDIFQRRRGRGRIYRLAGDHLDAALALTCLQMGFGRVFYLLGRRNDNLFFEKNEVAQMVHKLLLFGDVRNRHLLRRLLNSNRDILLSYVLHFMEEELNLGLDLGGSKALIELLGRLRDPRAIPVLVRIMEKSPEVQEEAIRLSATALIKIGLDSYRPLVEAYYRQLNRGNIGAACNILITLSYFQLPEVYNLLVSALNGGVEELKEAALRAAANFGDPLLIPHLRKLAGKKRSKLSSLAAAVLLDLCRINNLLMPDQYKYEQMVGDSGR